MKKIYVIFGLMVIGTVIYFTIFRNDDPDNRYRTVRPEITDIEITVDTTGVVRPRNRLEIKPPLSGRLEEVIIAEGDSIEKGEVIAWMSSTERSALLDTARSRGKTELKKWEDIYRPTPIIAPLSGFIIRRDIQPGQTVSSNDAIMVMADELIVQAQVDEIDISKLEKDQLATIQLDAYPQNPLPGKIEHIAFESEVVSNVTVYKVDILPLQESDLMRSGMNAGINITIKEKENVLVLDLFAIFSDGSNKTVLVKADTGEPVIKEVKTGLETGEKVEIVSGLSVEDTVMVEIPDSEGGGRGRGRGLPGM